MAVSVDDGFNWGIIMGKNKSSCYSPVDPAICELSASGSRVNVFIKT